MGNDVMSDNSLVYWGDASAVPTSLRLGVTPTEVFHQKYPFNVRQYIGVWKKETSDVAFKDGMIRATSQELSELVQRHMGLDVSECEVTHSVVRSREFGKVRNSQPEHIYYLCSHVSPNIEIEQFRAEKELKDAREEFEPYIDIITGKIPNLSASLINRIPQVIDPRARAYGIKYEWALAHLMGLVGDMFFDDVHTVFFACKDYETSKAKEWLDTNNLSRDVTVEIENDPVSGWIKGKFILNKNAVLAAKLSLDLV